MKGKRIGLALGGGGARGLAHIVVLEAFDELSIKPHRIAGTSSGAVMGALYASGRSGREIRKAILHYLTSKKKRRGPNQFIHAGILKWINLVHPGFGRGRLLDSSSFLTFLHKEIKVATFEELETPLSVVTSDVWRHEQVVFDSGNLFSALRASIAFPGLFSPVSYQNRSLVDGGLVNPIPYDILATDCDITIAVDVSGQQTTIPRSPPRFFDNIINSFQTMGQTILRDKLKYRPPDIYIKPDLVDIHILDFSKAKIILSQAKPVKDSLKKSLRAMLEK